MMKYMPNEADVTKLVEKSAAYDELLELAERLAAALAICQSRLGGDSLSANEAMDKFTGFKKSQVLRQDTERKGT